MIRFSLLLLLLISLATGTQAAATSGVGADDLIQAADKAVGYIVKSAKASNDSNIAQGNAKSKQFWQALKKLNTAINKASRGLTLQDETFFSALGDAASAVQEVKVAYALSGAKVAGVQEGLDKVDKATQQLLETFSLEAKVRDDNKPLTAKERNQLDTLKKKQAELERKLAEVEAKSAGNAQAISSLERARKQMQHIHHCDYNAAGFFTAMMAWHIIDGIIWGWSPWWGWGWWGGWWSPVVIIDIVDITIIDAYDWDYAVDDIAMADLDVELDQDDWVEAEAYLETEDFALDASEMEALGMEPDLQDEPVDDELLDAEPLDVSETPESMEESLDEPEIPETLEESLDEPEIPEAMEQPTDAPEIPETLEEQPLDAPEIPEAMEQPLDYPEPDDAMDDILMEDDVDDTLIEEGVEDMFDEGMFDE